MITLSQPLTNFPRIQMISLPNYELLRVIGSGSFGYVFEAFDRTKQRKVALKRIEKVGNQLSREYQILLQIKQCPNVVHIMDFFYSRTQDNRLVQNIVFEYCQDNLQNWISSSRNQRKLTPYSQLKLYFTQLLQGLAFLHSKNIAHRDLKPENVLIQAGVAKICDFGSSKILDSKKNTPYIVSRYYRCPELMLCITDYTTAIDIWAAGCILAELILQAPLFKGKTEGDQLFAIFRIMGSFSEREMAHYRGRVPFEKQLMSKLGEFKAKQLQQDFLEKGVPKEELQSLMDLLQKMLRYIPDERISASQAINHQYLKIE